MRKHFLLHLSSALTALALLSACAGLGAAPTPTPEPPEDATVMNQRLARTVNLGNALEAPNEGEWGVTLKEEYFQVIKDGGFTAVRIPIRWNAHAGASAPYTIDPTFFERVDWAVDQALSRGLAAVVNIHHYEELMLDPDGHTGRFIGLWTQIAEHYRHHPNALMFELLNEPNNSLTPGNWNRLLAETLTAVRATNPTRTIIIGGGEWNNYRSLKDLKLPEDDRHIIATFHYYNPFQFTHQGAEWVQGTQGWLGTTWKGTSAQRQALEYDFKGVAEWAREHDRPIFLGEFGAYSKADMDSRAIWTAFVARTAEKYGFSWSYWEFCAGFGVYDQTRNAWNDPLLHALIPPQ